MILNLDFEPCVSMPEEIKNDASLK